MEDFVVWCLAKYEGLQSPCSCCWLEWWLSSDKSQLTAHFYSSAGLAWPDPRSLPADTSSLSKSSQGSVTVCPGLLACWPSSSWFIETQSLSSQMLDIISIFRQEYIKDGQLKYLELLFQIFSTSEHHIYSPTHHLYFWGSMWRDMSSRNSFVILRSSPSPAKAKFLAK